MSSYKELLKQQEELAAKVAAAREKEVSSAIAKIREIADEYGLSPYEIFPATRKLTRQSLGGTKVAPKYRDPATGATWSGRGKAPRWMADKDRSQFQI